MYKKDNLYFGRQPIFDTHGNVYFYEIFYMESDEREAPKPSSKVAIANAISLVANYISTKNLFKDCGILLDIRGELKLVEEMLGVVDFANFTFFIKSTLEFSEQNIASLNKIAEFGVLLGLDMVSVSKGEIERLSPYLSLFDSVKIDVNNNSSLELLESIKLLKSKKNELKVIAQKIESKERYIEIKGCGFDLFQGYFFQKLSVTKYNPVSPSIKNVFQIYNQLDRDADIEVVVKTLRNYPDIIINLLQYVNRASVAKTNEISSIRQAINFLGRKVLKTWLLLFLYTDKKMSKYSISLLESAMIRAKIMQSVFKILDQRLEEKAFLVGMLSTIDALLENDIKNIMTDTVFDNDIKDALINRSGILGSILDLAILSERNDLRGQLLILDMYKIDYEKFLEILKGAHEWAYVHMKSIKE